MSHDLLFVDDDPLFIKRCKDLFADSPYQLKSAPSATQGIALLQEGLDPVVVVTGAAMREVSGPMFLAQVKDLYPVTQCIMVTGAHDLSFVMQAVNQGGLFRLYTKEVTDEELKRGVLAGVSHCLHRRQSLDAARSIVGFNEELEDLTYHLEKTVEYHTAKLKQSNEENIHLNQVLKSTVRELEGRDRILRHLLTVHQLDDTLQTILEVINDVLNISCGAIYIKSEDNALQAASVFPVETTCFDDEPSSFVQKAINGGRMEVMDNPQLDCTEVVVPIYKNDTILGAIEVIWLQEDGVARLSEDDLMRNGQSIYNFTVHTAIAICDSQIAKDKTSWGKTLDDVLMDFME